MYWFYCMYIITFILCSGTFYIIFKPNYAIILPSLINCYLYNLVTLCLCFFFIVTFYPVTIHPTIGSITKSMLQIIIKLSIVLLQKEKLLATLPSWEQVDGTC